MIIDLPERFKDLILEELKKPKSKQPFSEDFFLEMERSLKTIKRRYPSFETRLDDARDILIEKYKTSVIPAITDFRKLSKIATAPGNTGIDRNIAEKAIETALFNINIGIQEIYENTVANKYNERKFLLNVDNFAYYLENLTEEEIDDSEIKDALVKIKSIIDKLLIEED